MDTFPEWIKLIDERGYISTYKASRNFVSQHRTKLEQNLQAVAYTIGMTLDIHLALKRLSATSNAIVVLNAFCGGLEPSTAAEALGIEAVATKMRLFTSTVASTEFTAGYIRRGLDTLARLAADDLLAFYMDEPVFQDFAEVAEEAGRLVKEKYAKNFEPPVY